MNYKKTFNFLKSLPAKLNSFYKKKSKSGIKVNNKSKNKKDFDPVTNFDKSFEKYIRSLILKKFPNDSIIGEEFDDKKSDNHFQWSIDPIDGTRAFVIGAPTWSNLIGLSFKEKSKVEKLLLKEDTDNLHVINPIDIFCSPNLCEYFSDSYYFYIDHIHFGYFGAEKISDHFVDNFLVKSFKKP